MATNLNSACNCCSDRFIIPAPVSLEQRAKSRGLSKCGYLGDPCPEGESFGCNNGEAGKIYLKLIFTFQDGLGQQSFKIDCDNNISEWEGQPPITQTFTSEFDPNLEGFTNYCRETCDGFVPESGGFEQITTVENEYTDEMLLGNMQLLPFSEFSEWTPTGNFQAGTILARDFDTGVGRSYSETKLEYRITHPPSATGYLKVWIWSITGDYEANPSSPPEIYKSFYEYVWSGNPSNLNSGVGSESNRVYGSIESVENSEAENKLTSLYFAKWSIIEGYEPDDPIVTMEFNGNWIINFSRPDPDCNSNIMPNIFEPTTGITNVGQLVFLSNIKSNCS
jgi:hypothetical protein